MIRFALLLLILSVSASAASIIPRGGAGQTHYGNILNVAGGSILNVAAGSLCRASGC